MSKEVWKEKANELIEQILDVKEHIKSSQDDLNSLKSELVDLMEEYNVNEVNCKCGKANFVDFQREGLVKDAVVETVDDVNKGRINKIDMKNLTKEIKVHFLNVRSAC